MGSETVHLHAVNEVARESLYCIVLAAAAQDQVSSEGRNGSQHNKKAQATASLLYDAAHAARRVRVDSKSDSLTNRAKDRDLVRGLAHLNEKRNTYHCTKESAPSHPPNPAYIGVNIRNIAAAAFAHFFAFTCSVAGFRGGGWGVLIMT